MTDIGSKLADEIIAANEKLRIITHLSAQDENGDDVFFIIAVKPFYYEHFMKLTEIDDAAISEYGEIMYSGKGKKPDENIIKELKEKYEATYDFVDNMKELDALAKQLAKEIEGN